MAVRFHLPKLTLYDREIVQAALLHGIQEAWRQNLKIDNSDIWVRNNPRAVIPEVGVGAWAHSGHAISIAIDPTRISQPQFPQFVACAVTHEANHAQLYRKLGWGMTRLHGAIMEGKAIYSEEQAGFSESVYAREPDCQSLERYAQFALPDLSAPILLNKNNWYFGSADDPRYIRHGLYKLGRSIVRGYAKAKDLSAADILAVPDEVIFTALRAGEFALDTRAPERQDRLPGLHSARLPKCEFRPL